jgi:hypothetical protein
MVAVPMILCVIHINYSSNSDDTVFNPYYYGSSSDDTVLNPY